MVLGILLFILAYVLFTYKSTYTLNYSDGWRIPPRDHVSRCYTLYDEDTIVFNIRTNGTIRLVFGSKGIEQYIASIAPPSSRLSFNISSGAEYCIEIYNINDKMIYVEYNASIYRVVLREKMNSVISLTGIVLLLVGIMSFYRGLIKESSKYPDHIRLGDIECRSVAINKHECVIHHNIPDLKDLMNRIVDYMVSRGYRIKNMLSENVILLEKKGGFLPKKFDDKGRTIILCVDLDTIRIHYVISVLQSSGTIDLPGVFSEVKDVYVNVVKGFRSR